MDLVANPIYLFIYQDFHFYARYNHWMQICCFKVVTRQWETHCCAGGAVQSGRCHISIFLWHTHATWSRCHFKLCCMSPVAFCQSQLRHDGDTAEARGLSTRKPRDIIWFHFHLNSFPLADLILVSQYEPWPWISTGLQLVFNVHQSLMWVSPPHSGVLLTGPSPSRPTLGPSGPSRVPNHTSVSTVAKLLQSDWLGNTLMKKKKKKVTDHLGPSSVPHPCS